MRRAIATTTITVPVHDQGNLVGEKQGTITTIFDGDQTLDEVCSYLNNHKTNTTTIVFETPIKAPKPNHPGPKAVQ